MMSSNMGSEEKVKLHPLILKLTEKYPFLLYRTPFDRSELPCILDTLYQTLKSFCLGYGPIAAIKTLMLLRNVKQIKQNPLILLETFFSKKNLGIGMFLASFTFILKSTIIVLRTLRNKDDGKEAAIGGILGGYLSMFFIDRSSFLALFLFVRGMDCMVNSKLKDEKMKAKIVILAYAISVAGIVGFWMCLPQIVNPSMKRYIDKWAIQESSDYFTLALNRAVCRANGIKRSIFIK